nr:reverse transcriptase domain-containing protein [Tanacetum cinerariifolium]
MPRECLKIIESKFKVRQSRAKAVITKISTSSSTPVISSEVSELKDMVRALLLDKKNQSSAPTLSSTPAPVKAIKPANYNQGNTGFRPQMVANQIRPPRFPPHQNHQNNFNWGNNFNQSRVAPAYQSPIPQTLSVTQTNFESYIKANDAVLRNMQSHGQGVQNQCQGLQTQIANLMDMLSKFVSSNTASSSGSWTLPSNTITNPKEDLKGITTQSGAAYQRPPIPTQSKVVKQGTKVTKDQVQTPSSQSTVPVQPSVSQPETQTRVSKPVAAPVSVPIPYPSRRDNERRRDQANKQIEKFYEIFKEMSFEISFTDALILMPKFASTLKALIGNKEKLSEMARTPMNKHCSAVILNKLPRELGDPGKFLIPCEFPRIDECLALAYLGASINLMPLSVWEGLSLPELTPTCMTLELADRLVSKPIGIAKDVLVKVAVFHFPADFVVVDFEPDLPSSLNSREVFLKDCGNPTPYDDLVVSTTSPTLTLFGDSDFLVFEEADAFLGLEDDPDSPKINPFYYDPEGDILLLEAILNSKPLPHLPNHKQYMPSYKKELKGDKKFPVIIAKELGDEEKSALIKVLKSHKRAIAWKLSDIQ